jgi:DNA-binding MarR family transcriptional regulator
MKKEKKEKKEKKSVDKDLKKKKAQSPKKTEPAPMAASENPSAIAEKAATAKTPPTKTIGQILDLMKNNAELYQNIITAPHDFKAGDQTISLFPSELKTLEIIGKTPGINLTQLSIELDISKSAVSKCTGKMLEKSLLNKKPSPTNIRQVQFFLSEDGQAAFEQYLQLDLFKPLSNAFETLKDEDSDKLLTFLKAISKQLDEIAKGLPAQS